MDGIRRRLALGLLLALAGLPGARADAPDAAEPADRFAPPTPPALEQEDRSRLEAGATLVRDLPPSDAGGIGVILIGLIEAPPAQVWSVMADCEDQDEFLPRISHAAVRDRDGDSHTCDLVVDLPFPLQDARTATRHHVRRLEDGGYQRRWDLLPGDWSYHRNRGSWTVHPYADEGRSLLVSRMDMLPKSVIPTWILRAAYAEQAPATFEAIRARVRAYGNAGSRVLE
jgi:hypothetical protein